MAATLTVTTVDRSGALVDLGGANLTGCTSGGDSFANTGAQFVVINNALGGALTVTYVLQGKVDGQSATSKTMVIAAGKLAIGGPFPAAYYNDVNGLMNFTYSPTPTACKIGAFVLTST
jgi:hypothetical protein